MSQPLVSIFLPTHSRFQSGLMPKAVLSVLAQNYKCFEFFIVDDASSDGSENFLRDTASRDGRVSYIRHDKNVGLPALTLAQALVKSKGEFIAFAFDDTELLPHHLETLLSSFEAYPDAAMIYGGVSIEPPGSAPLLLGGEFDMKRLAVDNYVGNSGVMITRKAIEQVGFYDPHVLVKRTCDWDLWMRFGRKKLPVYYCNEVVAVEKGATQADSLGLSVSRYDELTRKYQQTDRNHLLSPQTIAEGKALMFHATQWMNEDERNQLNVLVFEHLIRTRDLERAIEVSKVWLNQPIAAPPDSHIASDADGAALLTAFNKYIAETRYACKNTCESAFKLNVLTERYDQIIEKYEHLRSIQEKYQKLSEQYRELHDQYHGLLRSLSWKVTKPLRDLTRICNRG